MDEDPTTLEQALAKIKEWREMWQYKCYEYRKANDELTVLREAMEFYAEIKNYQKDGLVDVSDHLEDFRPILGDYGSLARYILRLLKNKGEV